MDFKHRWSAGFKQNVFNSRINTTAALAKAISNATVKPKAFVTMSGIFYIHNRLIIKLCRWLTSKVFRCWDLSP